MFKPYKKACLILETGEVFSGFLVNRGHKKGSIDTVGEVVFNTSHTGYEEIATDPSYFSQIVVMTAPMQGNYGSLSLVRESNHFWIKAFICLELDDSCFREKERKIKNKNFLRKKDVSSSLKNLVIKTPSESQKNLVHPWIDSLINYKVPTLTAVDTREIVLRLRTKGVSLGAVIELHSKTDLKEAHVKARKLIEAFKKEDLDWAYQVSTKKLRIFKGDDSTGPKIAVLDFGCKKNILRELKKYTNEIALFPCRSQSEEIKKYKPHGILLSNGPGNPEDVKVALKTVKSLLSWRFIFGICMGHQILGMSLGGKTYKLPFGHRGSNHPVKNLLTQKVYVTSQNHGYALHKEGFLPSVQISHINMNDGSVAGFYSEEKKCMGIQFHPESAPGTHDAKGLFQEFVQKTSSSFKELKRDKEKILSPL